jgi:membrane protein implicated in regulation of membrane protease activity
VYLIAIAWMYVVVMMAVVEALAPNGSVLGAVFTFLLYGVLPLSVLMYILGTPLRRRRRQAAEAGPMPAASGADPDRRGEPAGDAVAPEREEA